MKKYDVIVIGAGLSGLTAASLLSKRGLNTLVIESQEEPGGACGIFKRDGVVFEQGVAMMNGFDENGLNPQRFLFNVLEEPIRVIEHKEVMILHYESDDIIFYEDLDEFIEEMISLFPMESTGIRRFYRDMGNLYSTINESHPWYQTLDTYKQGQIAGLILKHPFEAIKAYRYSNKNMKWLLEKYFKEPKLIHFYEKLLYSLCYTAAADVPAAYGATILMQIHNCKTCSPVGSSMQMIGKLVKVIEEHHGDILYHTPVISLCIKDYTVTGVRTADNQIIEANQVIYSGNIWSLYEDLLNLPYNVYEPSDSVMILSVLVKDDCIPQDAHTVEKFISDSDQPNESDITVYLSTLDDRTLCPDGYHILTAIGPTFRQWPEGHGDWYDSQAYQIQKDREEERMISVLRRRYSTIRDCIVHTELATPSTLTYYAKKYKGSFAGPKYMIGQQFFRRQHVETRIQNLYCCGEGNLLGSGSSAVTISGISAANILLRHNKMKEYNFDDIHCDFVTLVKPPYTKKETNPACRCNFCDHAACESACPYHLPISKINHKLASYNFTGVWKLMQDQNECPCEICEDRSCERVCMTKDTPYPVPIRDIIVHAMKLAPQNIAADDDSYSVSDILTK